MMKSIISTLIILVVFSASSFAFVPGTVPDDFEGGNTDGIISSLDPIATEVGYINWSIDAIGMMSSTAILHVDKPVGATVRSAHFFSATMGMSGYQLQPGDVKIDGVDVDWDIWHYPVGDPLDAYNYYADVTDMVRTKINTSPAGQIDFEITENNSSNIDGEVLMVIFDDPNQFEDVTIFVLFGHQAMGGDAFNIGLTEPIEENSVVYMSLGISYGHQPTDQVSLIDVNGDRLTSSAGGEDDGEPDNGALITAGGIGDSYDNPPDPYAPPSSPRYDDELYSLMPYLQIGDQTINVVTSNPSMDDNIFFGAFYVTGAAVVGEACVLTPTFETYDPGSDATVTATLQDDNGNRIPGRQIDFEVIGGPNAGITGSEVTNQDGQAFFTYTSNDEVGIDTVQASFINSQGNLQYANNYAYVEWSELEMWMVPDQAPVQVPAGSNFWYTGWINNHSANPLDINVWVKLRLPDNTYYGPIKLWDDLVTIPPDFQKSWHVRQLVPYYAPQGDYMYIAYGGIYETAIWDSCYMTMTVTGDPLGGDPSDSWAVEGWEPDLGSEGVPSHVSLNGSYPNPFNARANIEFSLPLETEVSIEVFNLLGQKVTTLVDGKMEAGRHVVTWDAANYASGIYLYRLKTGDNVITKRMSLVK